MTSSGGTGRCHGHQITSSAEQKVGVEAGLKVAEWPPLSTQRDGQSAVPTADDQEVMTGERVGEGATERGSLVSLQGMDYQERGNRSGGN